MESDPCAGFGAGRGVLAGAVWREARRQKRSGKGRCAVAQAGCEEDAAGSPVCGCPG